MHDNERKTVEVEKSAMIVSNSRKKHKTIETKETGFTNDILFLRPGAYVIRSPGLPIYWRLDPDPCFVHQNGVFAFASRGDPRSSRGFFNLLTS